MSHSLPRPDGIPAKIRLWRKDILKDMTHLPKVTGHKPGRIVVHGLNAAPIVKGTNNEHVVVAAAEVGDQHGRVVVFSHEEYLINFGGAKHPQMVILHENINHWVTKGNPAANRDVVRLHRIDSHRDLNLSRVKILVWCSGDPVSEEIEKKVTEYVMNGGALLYALSSFTWKMNNPRKHMLEIPFSNLLTKAGIMFTESKVLYNDPAKGFNIASSAHESLHDCHAQHLIKECLECELNGEVMFKKAIQLLNFFQEVPDSIVDHLKDDLERLFRRCHAIAVRNYPTPESEVRNKLARAAIVICNIISEFGLGYRKMPGIEYFPGDFEGGVESLKCMDLEFKSTVKEAHPTGLYVPAGTSVEIEVTSHTEEAHCEAAAAAADDDDNDHAHGWAIRIGAHSDKLYENDYMFRWPHVMVRKPLQPHQEVFTPYGGLLYFMSPDEPSTIKVKVTGVVEAPYFNLADPQTIRNWETIKHLPGLWADMSGKWFRITVPSSSIRDLTNPAEILQVWDQVILDNHDLRGTQPTRGEWVVADIQPVKGFLHSGYPIVSGLNMAEPDGALSIERMRESGVWGIFHELGHNMQRKMWTFEGTTEVTCNIFALYQTEKVARQPVWLNPWFDKHWEKIQSYLRQGPNFPKWQKMKGVGLSFYAQLVHSFGWKSYKKVFRSYEATPENLRPKETQQRIDEWMMRFSMAAGYNIVPMADFWAIPVSERAHRKLRALKPFLPDDEMTKMSPTRVQALEQQYPGLVRTVKN